MRKLTFEPIFNTSLEKVWQLFTEIHNYPRYIEFCQTAELVGPFAPGSHWKDHSTVVYLPMDIVHEIVTVEPAKKLEYRINLPGGGELWQRFHFSEVAGQTQLKVEIDINFTNKLMDFFLGPLVQRRNQTMINQTINNFQEALEHGNT